MSKRLHNKEVLKKKGFLSSFFVTVLLWLLFSGIVYFVDPGIFGAISLFFIVLFLALLFTFSLIFGNARRGLITSVSLILFIILRYFGVGNVLNFILLAALAGTIEFYFWKTS